MPKTSTPLTFDPDSYAKSTLNELVVYSTYFLHKRGAEITFEDIVSACFMLFPKRFALKGYPRWPDSAVVSRRWSDCKSKGYLLGSSIKGFKITAKGIRFAEKIEKSLGKPEPVRGARKTLHGEFKTRAGKFVRAIEKSEAYTRYKKRLEINEFDFRSLLLCTMESPPATLSRNLEQFKEYVNVHGRKDLLTFLEFNEGKFSYLLSANSKPDGKKAPRSKK